MFAQSFDIIIETITSRINCSDHTYTGLVRRAFNNYVHLRTNRHDYTAKRALQSIEGLIYRRENWLLRRGLLSERMYVILRERLERIV